MKKIALLLGLLFVTPVFAADNAVIVTPGTGVTMKSKDIGAGVQAMQPILSDTGGNALSTPTAGADGVSNTSTGLLGYSRNLVFNGTTWDRWLGAVTNAGTFAVQLTGATNNINNIAGTISLPTGASTSANQTTEIGVLNGVAQTTAHGCSVAGYGVLGCLGQIDDDVKGPIAAGSAIIGKVGIDQTTPGTTNGVQLPTTSNGGAATVKGGVGVVNGGSTYQAIAASQTATVLQSSTGATGDYLSHCTIYPTSTSPGVVTVFDNTNTAATSAILFPGGASSVSNLVPFAIPVGAVSTAGAWKVTTGANVSVVCEGKFS